MSDYIVGRNAAMEYLRTDRSAEKLFVQRGERKGSIVKLIGLAKHRGIPVIETDARRLGEMAEGENHQGAILLAQDYEYSTVEAMLASAREAGHAPFLVLLDGITDPHNLGAIIRSAEGAGADGVIIPKHRSASVNGAVHKISSGATSFMKIARVTNLNRIIDELKKANVWIYGAAGEASTCFWETDFTGGVGLVIGNEGEGLSRLTREKCDFIVSIPMLGQIDSLNASVSASILMYEIRRRRTQG